MTRVQRRVHLAAWLVLGPALLVAGALVMLRHEPPPRPVDGVATDALESRPIGEATTP